MSTSPTGEASPSGLSFDSGESTSARLWNPFGGTASFHPGDIVGLLIIAGAAHRDDRSDNQHYQTDDYCYGFHLRMSVSGSFDSRIVPDIVR